MVTLELVYLFELVGYSSNVNNREDSSGVGVEEITPYGELATTWSVKCVLFAASTTHYII